MGMTFLGCRSSTCTSNQPQAIAPNPRPGRFEMLRCVQVGNHCLVSIKYLDCTNFEGNKILVYLETHRDDILSMKEIDPHFSEAGKAPFARFEPTEFGWAMAENFLKYLNERQA